MNKSFLFYLSLRLLVLLLISGCAWNASAQSPTPQSSATLYKRLGGYDAIAAVTDEFLARAASDKQLSRFLVGLSNDSKRRLRQLIVDQLCEATGGPCFYTGRSTKVAHAGLGITESDWQLTVKHLAAILDKFKVPEKEKNDFLALASSLRGDIVEK
ncbi:MAG TPA: group 1 truncated hemoglobin [Candidatus Binatia bacterium]|jgi:hemoglobin|nr:group 1 truncated hemoglobin [Candidatus Binatia bacterium]